LDECRFIGDEADDLLRNLLRRNPNIKVLHLCRTRGVEVFSSDRSIGCTAQIEELTLDLNSLDDNKVACLSRHLMSELINVSKLSLKLNDLQPSGVGALINAMQHCNIGTLDLSSNLSIRSEGAILLASFLQEPSCRLKCLYLASAGVGDAGMEALGAALEVNQTLEAITLTGNLASDAGMRAFCQRLPRMSLKQLVIDFTRCKEETTREAFLKGILINYSLFEIVVESFHITVNGKTSHAKVVVNFVKDRNLWRQLLSNEKDSVPAGLWPDALATLTRNDFHLSGLYHALQGVLCCLLEHQVDNRKKRKSESRNSTKDLAMHEKFR
jgi:hypothetical protein